MKDRGLSGFNIRTNKAEPKLRVSAQSSEAGVRIHLQFSGLRLIKKILKVVYNDLSTHSMNADRAHARRDSMTAGSTVRQGRRTLPFESVFDRTNGDAHEDFAEGWVDVDHV